jgi:eukaryotic-like serine/threonine-protein kinase
MDTDRNLLFGVLALQAGLIDAGQFVEVCALWATQKACPLSDLLVERGWVLPEDLTHLEHLLQRKLQKHGGDARAGLATLPEQLRRSLAATGDEEVCRSIGDGLEGSDALAWAETLQTPAGQERYTLVQLHAQGGIGQVWLAHDHIFGRDVALKELRPRRAEAEINRSRFLREARITGQLEHPGIVPVYDLACQRGSGEPFYTMRFVHGRTLTQAAQNCHRRRKRGQAQPLEEIGLLNAFVTVCNTVAYAHSRGVVHRDLKGQNVVLGDFGEVIVLDWGLARLVDQPDDEADLPPIALDEDSTQTVQGQTLGTPAYMAPEQASGRLDQIGPRTDVYGLAAILYEVLTGEPPFSGETTHEVLRRVRLEAPCPPSRLRPDVPAPLEAACLKGLAKDPADRYDSATELAEVVQRWLADLAERRRTEEERERFFALSLDLLAIISFEGDFRLLNPAWGRTLGWTPEELLARRLTDLVHPDDRPPTAALLDRIAAGEAVTALEIRCLRPDGSHRWILWNATRMGDEPLVYAVGRDITERKLAEDALRRSRERFELAMRGSQDGLWDWDMGTNEVYLSPGYKAILGFGDNELPNRRRTFIERCHPDDWGNVEGAIRAHLAGETDHYEIEHRMLHRDGSYRWVLARGVALRDGQGKAYRMAGSIVDITDRKKAEEKLATALTSEQASREEAEQALEALRVSEAQYRCLADSIPHIVYTARPDGWVDYYNQRGFDFTGIPEDRAYGDGWYAAVHPDDLSHCAERWSEAMRTGQGYDIEFRLRRHDGVYRLHLVRAIPVRDAGGRVVKWFGTCTDIEDQRRSGPVANDQ